MRCQDNKIIGSSGFGKQLDPAQKDLFESFGKEGDLILAIAMSKQ